jgi:hypothetical protein
MKLPLVLVTVAAIALAVGLGFQARENARLQQQLEAARAAQAEEIAALKKRVGQLSNENEIFKNEAEALRKGKLAKAAPLVAKEQEPPKATPAAETAKAEGSGGNPMSKMFSDPGMRKLMRQQQGVALQMFYADLNKQLGLDETRRDELNALLKERQEALFDAGMAMMADGGDEKVAKKAAEETDAIQGRYTKQLKELLGDSYPAFEAYEKSLPDRMAVQQYQMQFSAAGQSLSDEQRAGLLQIMSEERAKSPPNPFAGGGAKNQLAVMQSDEALHSFLADQDALNQRVLARAGTVLTPEQVTQLESFQKQLSQMQAVGMQMGKQMMKGK